jgi:hypothetical protein
MLHEYVERMYLPVGAEAADEVAAGQDSSTVNEPAPPATVAAEP